MTSVDVQPGQVWVDENDDRGGWIRHIEVQAVDGSHAEVLSWWVPPTSGDDPSRKRRSRPRLSAFRRLVLWSDAPAAEEAGRG